ncbi:MAG: hypothetical protein SPD47_07115 [Oscillospiraceae bacterium]|nr:hypothetical protein [Oscillospiraceae bacterium]
MRIKRRSIFMPVLLAAMLAAGCSTPTGSEPQESSELTQTQEQTGQTKDAPQPDTTPEVSFTEHATPIGDSGLLSFGITADSIIPSPGYENGMVLSVDYMGADLTATLTDLYSGSVCSAVLPSGENWEDGRYYYFINGMPMSIKLSDSTVTVYDQELQPLHTETLGFSGNTCNLLGDALAIADNSAEKRVVFVRPDSDGSLNVSDIRAELPENTEMSQVVGAVRDVEYLIAYYDTDNYIYQYGILDGSTGSVTPLNISDSESVFTSGGKLVIEDYSTNSAGTVVFDPETPNVKKVLDTGSGTFLISPSAGNKSLYFFKSTPSDDNNGCVLNLYRYDSDSGRLTAELTADLPGSYTYISNSCEYGSDVLFTMASETGESSLVLWQPQDIQERSGYDAVCGADYSRLNAELSQKIKEKYSIEVLYGSSGVRHFNDYAVVAETSDRLINNALTLLDGFFAKFPEGFFQELISKSAGYDELCIYLTGRIIPNSNESQSINNAVAFVTTEDNKQLMVLDITESYELEMNTAHEFMHIIENAMYCLDYDENGEWLDKECFRRWEMLNPGDFSYYFSYTDEYGITLGNDVTQYNGAMYYDGCDIDINSIYFVDGYSMTFPKEDRARIFEHIATLSPDTLPAYFRGTAMQLKAAYLCACIRDIFDCITDDTVVFWESSVDKQYTLDYFRENYDIDAYYQENAMG